MRNMVMCIFQSAKVNLKKFKPFNRFKPFQKFWWGGQPFKLIKSLKLFKHLGIFIFCLHV
jgi:hypothetical protein